MTHQIEQVDRPAVLKYFREFMFSVEPLYDGENCDTTGE